MHGEGDGWIDGWIRSRVRREVEGKEGREDERKVGASKKKGGSRKAWSIHTLLVYPVSKLFLQMSRHGRDPPPLEREIACVNDDHDMISVSQPIDSH